MKQTQKEVKFAFNFPQGMVFFLKDEHSGEAGKAYFKPHQSVDAFEISGERKELFGKHALTVEKNKETGAGGYSVVYEFFWTGAAPDIRLVNDKKTVTGVLLVSDAAARMSDDIAAGKIILRDAEDMKPERIFNAAVFADGRILIQLFDKRELYLGTPGNYKKLDAKLLAQGGCSMYYKTRGGVEISLPYSYGGPGTKDIPVAGGEILKYLNVAPGTDPAELGLVLPPRVKAPDPFSPELEKSNPPPARKNGFPKPPGL